MKLLLLTASDLRRALPMEEAVQVMRDAFTELSLGEVHAPHRLVLPAADGRGTTLVMGASSPRFGVASKVVSVFPGNRDHGRPAVNGLAILVEPSTGVPVALCDGTFLTAWRTGAATGAATDALARTDARTATVIGSGSQARTQVLGIDSVRTLETIQIHGRSQEPARTLIDELQPHTRAHLELARDVKEAVQRADIVCTATSSPTPVFPGDSLTPGTHVNGMGSFTLAMQEIDVTAVSRSRVFVDAIDAARTEAGDLHAAREAGETSESSWTEIGEVFAKRKPGRTSPEEITLFKSVGHAIQDVAAGARALEAARSLGLGREVEL